MHQRRTSSGCIYVIRDSKGEKMEEGTESIFEKVVAEHFPNLIKTIYKNLESQESEENYTKVYI